MRIFNYFKVLKWINRFWLKNPRDKNVKTFFSFESKFLKMFLESRNTSSIDRLKTVTSKKYYTFSLYHSVKTIIPEKTWQWPKRPNFAIYCRIFNYTTIRIPAALHERHLPFMENKNKDFPLLLLSNIFFKNFTFCLNAMSI